jgi:hypothetical protein|tara:strand:- start:1653 stop:1850 length:198 start_codon:yes stop_codon:yes gene_type:complete
MSETKSSSSGLGLGTVLFLIFLVLKLTDKIDWSWWWITSPLWIPLSLGILIGGFIVFLKAIVDRH